MDHPTLTSRFARRLAALALVAAGAIPATAADWIHWRGPNQNGVAAETGIPASFGVGEVGKDNLVWRSNVGGRSAPLVMNGHLYLISASGTGLTEGERVVCLKEATGEQVWETKFNVFHTDIVSSRLGWTSLTADPASGTIYCHGTQGNVAAFDAKTGNIKWLRNLTEEFGRITGYGGRISSPIFDSGLVIVGFVNSSWGTHARGGNRYYAFDGKTGEVVWVSEVSNPQRMMKGTYYSNPVIAVINGQRQLITGGADGAVHAMKVRTGEVVWSHPIAVNIVNPSPVVDGNLVYISHGEENIGGGPIGKVLCLDASQVNAKTKTPKVVWETKRIALPSGGSRQGVRFGLSSPALADGVLYLPDDAGELYAFNAKDGKCLWTHKFGTVSRGAPLVVDGKLYVFDVNAKLTALKLNGKEEPEVLAEIPFRSTAGAGFVETHGTPIAVNGRLYFSTREFTYAIGAEKPTLGSVGSAAAAAETPFDDNAAPASLRIFPAEITTAPGQTVSLAVKFLDANGREVKAPADAKIEWSLPQPPAPTPMGAQPPALNGVLKADGATATVEIAKVPSQQGYVSVKAGNLTTTVNTWARVRVAPQVPYTNDFEKVPEGIAPGGWINANGKFLVKKLADGNKVLAKVNTDSRPPFARSNGFITATTSKAYAIECDLLGTKVRDQLPDMGLVNSRYLMVFEGKPDPNFDNKKTLRLVSWEARLRVNKVIEFDWKPDTWYTAKLVVEPTAKGADIKGKVWEKGKPEPTTWTIEFADPMPNLEGAASLYGYVTNIADPMPGSEIHYDNLKITPAKSSAAK
ncbi:MAG: PQQ-binding-like beta-propeller repeat protein [Gemmataceae bacterium]|nr:PQQ-binding-like beta-propeller repeat protein [Gemmataceae bacterium]